MTKYAQIAEDGNFDKIIKAKGGYTFTDGTSTGSIECFTATQLKAKGILPYEETRDTVSPRTHKLAPVAYTVLATKVKAEYKAVAKTPAEIQTDYDNAMVNLRNKRDSLLNETEYYEYSRKLTTTQKTDGLAYRDALFDLPNNIGNTHPDDVVFPNKPNS